MLSVRSCKNLLLRVNYCGTISCGQKMATKSDKKWGTLPISHRRSIRRWECTLAGWMTGAVSNCRRNSYSISRTCGKTRLFGNQPGQAHSSNLHHSAPGWETEKWLANPPAADAKAARTQAFQWRPTWGGSGEIDSQRPRSVFVDRPAPRAGNREPAGAAVRLSHADRSFKRQDLTRNAGARHRRTRVDDAKQTGRGGVALMAYAIIPSWPKNRSRCWGFRPEADFT